MLGRPYPITFGRCCAASSAASVSEMADAFFRVLKLNFALGARAVRVSWSFSERALMAWMLTTSGCQWAIVGSTEGRIAYSCICPLVVRRDVA